MSAVATIDTERPRVSIDGKTPSDFDYNVRVTREVVDMAHPLGVSVEGELGVLGSLETGMGEKEVTAEIERYIVNPGQACAYKVGMLKIQELRSRAQQELADKFDQREFHETLLKNGALPLEILEEQVNDYIQKKKA